MLDVFIIFVQVCHPMAVIIIIIIIIMWNMCCVCQMASEREGGSSSGSAQAPAQAPAPEERQERRRRVSSEAGALECVWTELLRSVNEFPSAAYSPYSHTHCFWQYILQNYIILAPRPPPLISTSSNWVIVSAESNQRQSWSVWFGFKVIIDTTPVIQTHIPAWGLC